MIISFAATNGTKAIAMFMGDDWNPCNPKDATIIKIDIPTIGKHVYLRTDSDRAIDLRARMHRALDRAIDHARRPGKDANRPKTKTFRKLWREALQAAKDDSLRVGSLGAGWKSVNGVEPRREMPGPGLFQNLARKLNVPEQALTASRREDGLWRVYLKPHKGHFKSEAMLPR